MTHFDSDELLEALLRSKLAYSEWEKGFLESVESQNAYKGVISDAQRAILERMVKQYGVDVKVMTAHWHTDSVSDSDLKGYKDRNPMVAEFLSHQEYWQTRDDYLKQPYNDATEAWLRANDPNRRGKKKRT